ncbi:MAG: diguanylate cyclase [Candidatus Omnitrophota bacterium]|jgi:diguanylate cyclase (GGDEF)-like protein/PAS domain S-box-containing protein
MKDEEDPGKETVSPLTENNNIEKSNDADGALAASEANYRAIFDAANDAIFILDTETFNVVDVNRKGCEMFCYSRNEIECIGMEALGAGEAVNLKNDIQERVNRVSRGEPQIFEWLAKDKAGRNFWAEINLKRAVVGGKYRLLAIIRDINERKDAERRLEALNVELSRSNRRLKHLSLLDPHTGLYNFRYLGESVEAEFEKARRQASPVSAIMFDIDYFKSINDVYGHQFGDLVLKQLARQIKAIVRRYDIVIRFGGEEFIILSPGTSKAGAVLLANRLLGKINGYSFGSGEHKVKIEMSMAVASYPEDAGIIKGMDLINIADRVLNKVKESGGNKVYSLDDINRRAQGSFSGGVDNDEVRYIKDKIEKQARRSNQNLVQEMFAFARTVGSKDRYEHGHTEKLLRSVSDLSGALGLSDVQSEQVMKAAALYDLGKIGISWKTLQKRSKLTREEFNEVKKHPQIGADIISPIQSMRDIVPIVLYHHERWDGKGYPAGLKAEEIPLGARIISLVDAYHALGSDRPYRKAYPRDKVLKIIKNGSGTCFDPKVTKAFISVSKYKK